VDEDEDSNETTTRPAITIGGDKGHVIAQVDDAIKFLKICQNYGWKIHPNCTG